MSLNVYSDSKMESDNPWVILGYHYHSGVAHWTAALCVAELWNGSQWRRALGVASAAAAALVAELLQSCTAAAALMATLRSRAAAELLVGRCL